MLRKSLNLGRIAALLAFGSGAVLLADGAQTGTVSGVVKDQSGAVISGVKLQMQGANLQGLRTATSGANGDYRFLLLPPGKYTLTAERDGFNTTRIELTVSINFSTAANVPMSKIGNAVVVVTAPSTTIEQGTVTGQASVSKELVDRLPVGRTYQGMMQLTPGVTGGGNPNVLGGQSSENIYLVDGVDTTDPTTGTFGLNLAEDSIQEVQVLTTGISAEFGRFNGAVANVVTKSGTNEFEGQVRYNFSNIAWNAVTPPGQKFVGGQYVDNSTTKPASNLVKTPYITVGGPIFKDRLWYFASFQIPSTSFQSATNPGPLGGGGIPFDRTFKADKSWYSAKLTWAINSDHSLIFQATGDPALINRINYGSTTFLDTTTRQRQGGNFTSLTYRGVLSQNLTLEGKFAKQTSEIVVSGEGGGTKNAFYDQTGGYRQYENGPFEGYVKRPRVQGNVSVTWFPQWMGSHEVRAGIDYQKTNSKNKFGSIGNQDVYFSGFTGNVATPGGPFGYNYNMVPGDDYLEIFTPLLESSTENKYTALYVNDRWAVNNQWAINIGLRRESIKGNNDIGLTIWDYNTFAPRLGLTFDPAGDGTTTFGVTFGRYFQSPFQDGLDNQNRLAQGLDDYSYVAGDPHLRSSFGATPFNSNRPTNDPGLRFASDVKGPHTDETTVVYKHAASSRLSFQVIGVYKEFKDPLITTVYYEPTTNIRVRLLQNGSNAKRHYAGLLMSSEYHGEKYTFLGNATISRLYGTIDQSSETGSYNVLTTGTYAPSYNTNNAGGLLSADRTLVVKLFGTRKFTWDKFYWDHGFRFQFTSGAPYQLAYNRRDAAAPTYVTNPFDRNLSVIFGGVRNTNRFNDNYNVDYSTTFGFDFTKRYKVFLRADINNVFNHQQQVTWNTTVVYNNTTGTIAPGALYGRPTGIGNYVTARTLLFSMGLKF